VELDDVIDQMIAERVIHRHRRKWLVLIALIVVLVLVVLLLGGWKERTGALIDVVEAPYSVNAGRFEIGVKSAVIRHTPKGKYTDAETVVQVGIDVRNIDDETRASESVGNAVLQLATKNDDVLQSKGATCRGELNYKLVYGLPALNCVAEFEVSAGYDDTDVKVGVVGEEYRSDEGFGVVDRPYWHDGHALVVVRMTATKETVRK
jgi:hypothetical protein